MHIFVFKDARDLFWTSVVTQCTGSELTKTVSEQKYQPLAFLSGSFINSEMRWNRFEEEVFEILQNFRRLYYMILCETLIRVFNDLINLLFVFCPTLLDPSLGRHKIMKVLRWEVYLSQFNYQTEHVHGEENLMPLIMKSSIRGYIRKKAAVKRVIDLLNDLDIVPSTTSTYFDWPNITNVRNAQIQENSNGSFKSNRDASGIILVHRKCGFRMKQMNFSYASSSPLILVPAATVSQIKPPPSFLSDICGIKDYLSSYVWLVPTEAADEKYAAKSFCRLICSFTAMNHWVSDQVSHFKNSMI